MTATDDLFDASGRRICLGTKIGSGGEGDVYEVAGSTHDIVAKMYHEPLTPEKQEKLSRMVRGDDNIIGSIAAWPRGTLHLGRHGPVRGFLMPRVVGYEPIHKLYSPAQRKQLFPQADWAFLVNTARNVAAAFDLIHQHGHVIGDVNEGNVVVAVNSVVKLIDCDSFQVTGSGMLHLCEVGVPHFTPPELQRLQSFHGLRRTANHDNFGLAVLCFHLLFLGRHPFAGVYTGRGDMPIEKAIETFQFAYGKDAASRSMSPPPHSVTLDVVPPQVAQLFARAFSEAGAQIDGRPRAREWGEALDQLKGQLRTCPQEGMHKYFAGLSSCPWCRLEHRSGVIFFMGALAILWDETTFDVSGLWRAIVAIPSPGNPPRIEPSQFQVTAKPLPEALRAYRNAGFFKKIFLFFTHSDDSSERDSRQSALDEAERWWTDMARRWSREASDRTFRDKLQALTQLKSHYQDLRTEYEKEKQKLVAASRQRQLHSFLDRHFIQHHTIPNIGLGRKAVLASFGIETAADIDPYRIRTIKGFGEGLTNDLARWRKTLENRFVFDPSRAIEPADIAALNHRFRQRKTQIERTLLAGAEVLSQIREETMRKRQRLQPEVQAAARAVAQARADLAVL